ncbi:hypothetical protein [Streptomyces atratus]
MPDLVDQTHPALPRKPYHFVIGFNALAVSDLSAGDAGNAMHELLSSLMSWTASGILAFLDGQDRDRINPDK